MLNWFKKKELPVAHKDKAVIGVGVDRSNNCFINIQVEKESETIFAEIVFALLTGQLTDDIMLNLADFCEKNEIDFDKIRRKFDELLKTLEAKDEPYIRPSETFDDTYPQ